MEKPKPTILSKKVSPDPQRLWQCSGREQGATWHGLENQSAQRWPWASYQTSFWFVWGFLIGEKGDGDACGTDHTEILQELNEQIYGKVFFNILFIFRLRGREGEREGEREASVWERNIDGPQPRHVPDCDLWLCKITPNQLSHTSQDLYVKVF